MSDFILRGTVTKQGGSSVPAIRASDDGSLVALTRYQELALRGKVFTVSKAAMTLPVNAATLVSVFSIYNPPSSNVFLDIVDVEAHYVVATTVVNALGVYYSPANLAILGTFTTQLQSSVENARVGEGQAANAQFYSAYTHSGTPRLLDLVGGWGAVTDGGSTPIRRGFDGKVLIPPGVVISLAMTTAAATASGVTATVRWAEIPYVAM